MMELTNKKAIILLLMSWLVIFILTSGFAFQYLVISCWIGLPITPLTIFVITVLAGLSSIGLVIWIGTSKTLWG